jgi:hypothetical protein
MDHFLSGAPNTVAMEQKQTLDDGRLRQLLLAKCRDGDVDSCRPKPAELLGVERIPPTSRHRRNFLQMSHASKRTALSNYIRDEMFGSWLNGFLTVCSLIGYISVAVSLTTLVRWVTESWPGHIEFIVYIFVTYAATVMLFAAWIAVARSVHYRVKGVGEQIDLMAEAQHKLAEVVRRHAVSAESRVQLDQDTALRDTFSSKILPYLAKKLGRQDITAAVKYAGRSMPAVDAAPGAPRTPRQLTAVFRYPSVEGRSSQRPQMMDGDESFVYWSFCETDRRKQWVVIRDTEKLAGGESVSVDISDRNHRYKLHATKCGFRSVIAFPLREPEALGAGTAAAPVKIRVSNILGFLSFDCPDPDGFDPLFAPMSRKERKAMDNEGTKLKATKELEFFYGLADTLATLAVLGDKANDGAQTK